MRKILILCILVASMFANEKKLLIPLYSHPNLWNDKEELFEKMKEKDIDVYAIINPHNGPGEVAQEDYANGIRLLKLYDIKVIGYVYTQYGKRDHFLVKEDIYHWSNFYQQIGVDGIFFDETASDAKVLPYYEDLTSYARSLDFNFLILNPGYTTNIEYINSKIADVIVTYENSMEAWNNSFPKVINKETENTKLSLLLHTLKDNDFEKVLKDEKIKNFSYIYITEDTLANPWDDISSKLIETLIK